MEGEIKMLKRPTDYPMNHFRYVSISLGSMISSLYLCEVEVLSSSSEQISISQCSSEGSLESAVVNHNNCLHLGDDLKRSFADSLQFCKEKGLGMVHNKTLEGSFSYDFVRSTHLLSCLIPIN